MKKSIISAAVLLLLGTSVFAAPPRKSLPAGPEDQMEFVQLKSDDGFGVQIAKEATGKAFVVIYDEDKNLIFKDLLSKGASGQKEYQIDDLDIGDYTVEAISNGETIKKRMHVYDDGKEKSYFFYQ